MNIKVFLSTEFLSNIAQRTHEDLFEIKRKRVLHTKYLPCLQGVIIKILRTLQSQLEQPSK